MAKNSRRRNKAQHSSASKARPSSEQQPKAKTKGAPQDEHTEHTSSDDGWIDDSITIDGIDLDVWIADKIAAAIAKLPKDRIAPEVIRQLVDEVLSDPAKTSQRRKPGPKADWRFVVAGEAYNFRQERGRIPSFKELDARCQNKVDQPLDETNTYKLLTYLGVAG